MYCEHCGKKIDFDSNYCEYCGKKVTEEKKKRQQRGNKILIIILFLAVFGYIFLLELKYFNSPNNAMNQYLKNWVNKNYDIIQKNIGLEESPFISKEIFQTVFAEKEEFLMKEFQVNECSYGNTKDTATCNVTFQKNKNGKNSQKTYQLRRESKNKMLLFADWTIIDNSFAAINDWTLYVPSNSNALIQNIPIQEYRNEEKDKQGFDAYTIPYIYKGKYHVKITLNTGMNLEKDIDISKDEYTYIFNIQDVSKEFQEETQKFGIALVESLYNSVISKKKFEEIECGFDIGALKGDYDNLQKALEKSNLTMFKILDMEVRKIDLLEDGKIFLSFQMKYEYQLKYEKDHKEITYQGQSNDTFHITVQDENLKEVVKIESLVTYFSKK